MNEIINNFKKSLTHGWKVSNEGLFDNLFGKKVGEVKFKGIDNAKPGDTIKIKSNSYSGIVIDINNPDPLIGLAQLDPLKYINLSDKRETLMKAITKVDKKLAPIVKEYHQSTEALKKQCNWSEQFGFSTQEDWDKWEELTKGIVAKINTIKSNTIARELKDYTTAKEEVKYNSDTHGWKSFVLKTNEEYKQILSNVSLSKLEKVITPLVEELGADWDRLREGYEDFNFYKLYKIHAEIVQDDPYLFEYTSDDSFLSTVYRELDPYKDDIYEANNDVYIAIEWYYNYLKQLNLNAADLSIEDITIDPNLIAVEDSTGEMDEDVPDDEKKRIYEYLEANIGPQVEELKVYSAREVNRPLYHMSMNTNIKTFTPQISQRTMNKENRSIPRISTSTSLVGCFNGYQSMFADVSNKVRGKGKNKRGDWEGRYRLYELPYSYAVQPSSKLLPDVKLSDEYWLVSWKRDTYVTTPRPVADFIIPQVIEQYSKHGTIKNVQVYMEVKADTLYITHDTKLKRGYYILDFVDYKFNYKLDKNKNIKVTPITQKDWNNMYTFAIQVKKQ